MKVHKIMEQTELTEQLEKIRGKLIAIEQPRPNRLYLSCESENSREIVKFLFEDVGARFCVATAIDADHCFEVLYHFSYDRTGCVISVKAFIRDRNKPSIESVSHFLPAAEWIEREIHDTFGIEFRNHPDMRRLILADDWPQGVYPMRKEGTK